MIIECGHCGAPLDVEKGAAIAKCQYCATSNRVQELRTVAAETPDGWQAPRQWRPPAHAHADSTQTLTYHAAQAARGAVRMVVGLVTTALLFGGAGIAVFMFSATSAVEKASRALGNAGVGADVQAQVAEAMDRVNKSLGDVKKAQRATEIGGSQTSLLTSAGVQEALAGYKAALGVSSLKLQQLVLHDTHSSVKAQSPKDPQHIDGYRYRGGEVTGPDPERLSARDKLSLKTTLFDPEKTALHKLDELKTVALGQLAYEQAVISHVIVDRDRGATTLRIYGTSPRDSGYVLFSDVGKVVRVYR